MSLSDRLRGAIITGLSATKAATPAIRDSAQIHRIIGGVNGNITTSPPPAGSRNLLKLYESNPWVHSMIGKIASACAGVDLAILERDDESVPNHPALDFLNSGSPYLSAYDSRRVHHIYMKLVGESFWVIGRDRRGRPASWMPIPPTWVLDVALEPGEFFSISTPNNGNFDLPYEDVFWFRNVNPLDPVGRGVGIIRTMSRDLNIGAGASEFLDSFLKNRARPELIVTGTKEAPLQETDVKRLEDIWIPKFQGVRNAGRPLFSSNPLEIKPMDLKLRDQQMVELRRYQDTVIAEMLGIPPEIFGRIENSNRATVEGADYLFNLHVVVPEINSLVHALRHRLQPEFKDLAARKVWYISPVAENREIALKAVVAAPHAFKVNDVRKIAGLPPIKGSDGDQRPPLQQQTALKPGDAGTPGGQGQQQKPKKGFATHKAMSEASSAAICAAIKSNHEAEVDAMTESLYEAAQVYAIVVAADVGEYTFTADDKVACRSIAEEMIRNIDETTCSEIEEAMSGADEEDDISILIAAVFRRAKSKRIKSIAETEATRVAAHISLSALKAKGLTRKVWRTLGDERVRDQHAAMNGQVRLLDEAFTAPSGDAAMAPGGFSSVNLNANCRCYVTHDPSEVNGQVSTRSHGPALNGLMAVIGGDLEDYFDSQLNLALAALGEDHDE